MSKYVPPVQSKVSQLFDVAVLLVLSFGALYLPLWMGMAGSAKVENAIDNPTWEALQQNPTMVAQWNALGYPDAASAAGMITPRFDYNFSVQNLVIMAVVLIGYFFLMIKFSEKEYREVIAEKFDEK